MDHAAFINLAAAMKYPIPYPAYSAKAKHEGTVVLLLTIGPKGDILKRSVYTSSGWPDLDRAALADSERWVDVFIPAVKDGKPVESQAFRPVTYALQNITKRP